MPQRLPLIDIHGHLLPDLDDGAADWEEALAMARMAAADGISTSILTPHQLGAYGANRGPCILAKAAQFQQLLDRNRVALRVLPGAEARIEPGLAAKVKRGEVLALADRARHVLLELPHDAYFPLERLLADLGAAGLIGILAHPERNARLLTRPDLLPPLVKSGCLLQVTAGSVLGTFGSEVQKLAQRLVRDGLAHFLASDAHGIQSRRPLLARAFEWVTESVGHDAALDLCCRNPACVVEGNDIATSRNGGGKTGRGGWRWRKAG